MAGRSNRALKREKSRKGAELRLSKFTLVVDRQKGLCWYCGEVMGADCTKEHLLAKARGGTDTHPVGNLRAAHGECNSAAGHLPVSDKERLREVGLAEGRDAMLRLAKQLRRADARIGFSREPGPRYWKKLGLPGKPSWWDG